MSDRRMEAYYYEFSKTGVAAVDKILGAVACAGKAYHSTSEWNDEASPSDDHTGDTPVAWVQNAAQEAADRIEGLERENVQMKFALGYPMPSSLEHLVIPENPFRCGTCAAKTARVNEMEADWQWNKAAARREALEEAAREAESKINNAGDWASSYWDQAACSIAAAIRKLMEKGE